MGSVKYQVVDSLQKNTVPMMDQKRIDAEKIPTSRHEMKQQNGEEKFNHLIFSYSSYETYRDRCIVFAEYCKENYDISELREITAEMVKEFFEDRKELSEWTKQADYSAISKLENCLENRNWISEGEKFQVDVEELPINERKLENRQKGGPYLQEQVEAIKEEIPTEIVEVVEIVEETGARIHELNNPYPPEIIDSERVKLVGKGGKERIVSLSPEIVKKIADVGLNENGLPFSKKKFRMLSKQPVIHEKLKQEVFTGLGVMQL